MAKKGRPSKSKRIQVGDWGSLAEKREHIDIVLQSPEIFHFDIASYMALIRDATSIEAYNRAQLFDIYNSILLDLHLTGIINKRLIGVSRIPIEFRRDGQPVDEVNVHLKSPWFRQFIKDVMWSKFYGFSLFQFYRDAEGWIKYDLIPRKHYDPIKREILRYETDISGIPVEEYSNMLYVGESDRDLGLLAKLAPMVLYKRGNIGDWAQFCQVFGMPIREYTYDAGDEEARTRLLAVAKRQGANAVYIHPKDSAMTLHEASGKSGTVDLYNTFASFCNTEMSIAVLGNTLTTDAKNTGTQALGKVHMEEEQELKDDDRDFILDVLNYEMADIFSALGVNTQGGEFMYITTRVIDKKEQISVVEKLHGMGLPISDDYLYETFEVDKPENYEAMKRETVIREQEKATIQAAFEERLNDKTFFSRLRDFFVRAPKDGASDQPLAF